MRYLNNRGFTLIESLLTCAIYFIGSFLIASLIVIYMKMPSSDEVLQEVKWEVASFDVSHLIVKEAKSVNIYNNKGELTVKDGEGYFDIKISNDQLYKSKKGGYQLILYPIPYGRWYLENKNARLFARLSDGTMKERTFYVPKIE